MASIEAGTEAAALLVITFTCCQLLLSLPIVVAVVVVVCCVGVIPLISWMTLHFGDDNDGGVAAFYACCTRAAGHAPPSRSLWHLQS